MRQPAHVGVRPAIKHVPRSVVRDAHERIVRCGLGIVPVSSVTEDKFAGWSWGCVSAIDSRGQTIWIVDAHRDDGNRFIVHAEELLI